MSLTDCNTIMTHLIARQQHNGIAQVIHTCKHLLEEYRLKILQQPQNEKIKRFHLHPMRTIQASIECATGDQVHTHVDIFLQNSVNSPLVTFLNTCISGHNPDCKKVLEMLQYLYKKIMINSDHSAIVCDIF